MIRFQWNALRAGDPVRLHPDGGPLADGVVAKVDVLEGSNGIGVRVSSAGGETRVLWPSRLAVHDPVGDIDDPCCHCPPRVAQGRAADAARP